VVPKEATQCLKEKEVPYMTSPDSSMPLRFLHKAHNQCFEMKHKHKSLTVISHVNMG